MYEVSSSTVRACIVSEWAFQLFFPTHSFPNFICSRTGQNSQQPFTHMTKENRLSAPSQLKAWYCSPSQVKTPVFQHLQPEHLHIAISQLLNSLSKLNETVNRCVHQLLKFLVGTVWLQVMGDGVVGTEQFSHHDCYSQISIMDTENTGPKHGLP